MNLRIFIGVDPRQPLAFTVLASSIIRRASRPVLICPLVLPQLPIKRKGLTDFTFSRFLAPWLCDFKGYSVFMDADILVLCDIYELLEATDKLAAVSVVKNEQRFEWASLMVFNNACCQKLMPEYIESNNLFDFDWAPSIGELPSQFNHCVGYDKPRRDANIVHYTQGIPCFQETEDSEYRDEWMDEYKSALYSVPWKDIMGRSVHYKAVMERYSKRQEEAA